jgi:hypothetical protein
LKKVRRLREIAKRWRQLARFEVVEKTIKALDAIAADAEREKL